MYELKALDGRYRTPVLSFLGSTGHLAVFACHFGRNRHIALLGQRTLPLTFSHVVGRAVSLPLIQVCVELFHSDLYRGMRYVRNDDSIRQRVLPTSLVGSTDMMVRFSQK